MIFHHWGWGRGIATDDDNYPIFCRLESSWMLGWQASNLQKLILPMLVDAPDWLCFLLGREIWQWNTLRAVPRPQTCSTRNPRLSEPGMRSLTVFFSHTTAFASIYAGAPWLFSCTEFERQQNISATELPKFLANHRKLHPHFTVSWLPAVRYFEVNLMRLPFFAQNVICSLFLGHSCVSVGLSRIQTWLCFIFWASQKWNPFQGWLFWFTCWWYSLSSELQRAWTEMV